MAKLIVVQTGGFAILHCRKLARELGLTPEQAYFYGEAWDDLIAEQITPDEDQILITGSIHGDDLGAHEMVRGFKSMSPRLKVWWCSLLGVQLPNGLYDHMVDADPYSGYAHYEPMLKKAIEELGMVTTTIK